METLFTASLWTLTILIIVCTVGLGFLKDSLLQFAMKLLMANSVLVAAVAAYLTW